MTEYRVYDAIFFDLDGTLRANMPEGFEAFVEYAGRVGVALTDAQIQQCEREAHRYWASTRVDTDMAHFDQRGFWVNYNQILLAGMGVADCDGCAERIQTLFDHYDPVDVVFGDARHVLETLKNAGYTLALVSNRDTDLMPIATRYGFESFFDTVLWATKAGAYKPDRRIFDMALEMVGLTDPARVLYVGDNYFADVVGATNAGMDAILIDPRGVFEGWHPHRVKKLGDILNYIDPAGPPKQG
jgi:putative hydrolase of the HAD superfamily